MKKLTVLGLLVVALAANYVAFAGTGNGNTPMEAFIHREKQQTQFVQVSDLWQRDAEYNLEDLVQYTDNAQVFVISKNKLAEMMSSKNRAITLSIPNGNGGVYNVELARYDFLSKEFKVEEMANGTAKEVAYTPGLYYRGIVRDMPQSVAAFSFFNNEVYGIFSIPNVGNMVLVPNTLMPNQTDHYILYNDAQLKFQPEGPGCTAETLPGYHDIEPDMSQARNVYNTLKDVEMYLEADFATYLSCVQNTTTVVNYLTSTYNVIATLYRNEGIYTSIKQINVNTAMDIYQNANSSSHDFLNMFGNATQNNMHGADLAMLVSTRYGSLGGVAWVNQLCNGYNGGSGPYSFSNIKTSINTPGFPLYSWNVECMTHEMGHNIGSRHTHNCVWPGGAIDGCQTLEGNCAMPSPQYPVGGGTIMSYCHLVSSVGINFSKGFGPLPGDLIRNKVNGASCADYYIPIKPITTANTTKLANREGIDGNGVTYYFDDNNNAIEDDDILIISAKNNGNVIGTLDDVGFEVKGTTDAGYSSGSAVNVAFPAGTQGVLNNTIAMQRFWQMKTISQPTSDVEIMFPFVQTDMNDMNGSLPLSINYNNLKVYKVNGTIDPNPANGFAGAGPNDIAMYNYNSSPSTSQWTASTNGGTTFAHFLVNSFPSGGSVIYTTAHALSVNESNTATDRVIVYPNPTRNEWTVVVPQSLGEEVNFELVGADGRVVASQELKAGVENKIDATKLAAGMYFYRASGSNNTVTGALQKQ